MMACSLPLHGGQTSDGMWRPDGEVVDEKRGIVRPGLSQKRARGMCTSNIPPPHTALHCHRPPNIGNKL